MILNGILLTAGLLFFVTSSVVSNRIERDPDYWSANTAFAQFAKVTTTYGAIVIFGALIYSFFVFDIWIPILSFLTATILGGYALRLRPIKSYPSLYAAIGSAGGIILTVSAVFAQVTR